MERSFLPLLTLAVLLKHAAGQCLADPDLNALFEDGGTIPAEGSCCMSDVCGLPCPVPVPPPSKGYGIAVGISVFISVFTGLATSFMVHGEALNYFIAGRSLPLWMVAVTLASQAVDSNALLGNVDNSYKYQFYDGAVIPIGLALSLMLNAIFFAGKINNELVLTLPDIYAKRYGKVVECLISCATIASFLFLLAGNLVGMGVIVAYTWGISDAAGIWIAALIDWGYTVCGGLFSVAYTDVVQGLMGWSGCLVAAFWFICNQNPNAPPPSIGFPGYVYPDLIGEGGACDMYFGVACTVNATRCCYNSDMWCPSADNCTTDNGAYPIGDQRVFSDQMTTAVALNPFPNAIFWNWCTIFILGFGNLAALDFQGRCMAAKTPFAATWGCVLGGLFCLFLGIPFSYLGAITRVFYGPDSDHAEYDVDTCSTILGLPTCGEWIPDPQAFMMLLTHDAPPFLGAWCLIGIVAASMSTASGAMLAMGTVFSHNIMRQADVIYPSLITGKNLLLMARLSTVPFTLISTLIAAYYRSGSTGNATGYLLIVAFDVVLATAVASLFAAFYIKDPSPRAAFCAFIAGASTRIILEFALPKDGYLILPFNHPEFYKYGTAASGSFPPFYDLPPEDIWDPSTQPCYQEQYDDYTGVDSLAAFLCSIIVFLTVQYLEHGRGPLFDFPGLQGYEKDLEDKAVDIEEEAPADEVHKGVLDATHVTSRTDLGGDDVIVDEEGDADIDDVQDAKAVVEVEA